LLHLQVLATVEPTSANVQPAQVGLHDVTVANPDDVYGLQQSGFEVLINPARFDINKSDPATTNRIDGKDTIYLSRIFASSRTQPPVRPRLRLRRDGWVDGADLTYIAINLGRCWSSSNGTWSASACPAGPAMIPAAGSDEDDDIDRVGGARACSRVRRRRR
jgi:hypothetical protein